MMFGQYIPKQAVKEVELGGQMRDSTKGRIASAIATRRKRPFQERTNLSLEVQNKENLAQRHYASNSNITQHPTTLVQPNQNTLRRLRRYSLAEGALVATLQHCNTEATPQELQIRALEKATSILSAHAQDARDRAEKLRLYLADREMDPETFESLKRERWMEEKRKIAVDEETKILRQHLANLLNNSSPCADESDDHVRKVDMKRRANLVKFFQSSKTDAPIRSSRTYLERPTRRMTMADVSPMRLRTSSVKAAFTHSIKGHLRSASLDGQRNGSRQRSHISSSKATNNDVGLMDVVSENPLPGPAEHVDTDSSVVTHLPMSIDPISGSSTDCSSLLTPKSLRPSIFDDLDGTATIYRTTAPQYSSKDALKDIQVTLPDYALPLLTTFDPDYVIPPMVPVSPSPRFRRRITSSLPPPSSFTRMNHQLPIPPNTDSHSPTPSPTKARSALRRQPSGRSLFAIPEALTSRFGMDSRTRSEASTPHSSTASLTAGEGTPTPIPHGHEEKLASKLRRRFSVLNLKRSD